MEGARDGYFEQCLARDSALQQSRLGRLGSTKQFRIIILKAAWARINSDLSRYP